jgi:hypothetical protein
VVASHVMRVHGPGRAQGSALLGSTLLLTSHYSLPVSFVGLLAPATSPDGGSVVTMGVVGSREGEVALS